MFICDDCGKEIGGAPVIHQVDSTARMVCLPCISRSHLPWTDEYKERQETETTEEPPEGS